VPKPWRLIASLLATTGCTVLYGDPPIGQCETDAECAAIGAAGDRCDTEQRVCVASTAAVPLLAAAPEGCTAPGAASFGDCGDGECAAPLSSECSCLEGAWNDPGALVLGVIAPETFGSRSGQSLQIPYVPRWEKALSLALEEWSQELPDGELPRSGRRLALLRCNSNDELLHARRAMSHLIDNVHAPLVITLTDNDTESIRYQAQRQGTSVVCSTCFAAPPQDRERAAPVWQIAPPLVDQAALAAFRVTDALGGQQPPSAPELDPPTVVGLSQDYPGINEFMSAVLQQLEQSGRYHLVPIQTVNPHAGEVTQTDVARSVIDARPRVIVVGMDSDFTTYYLRLIESGWPANEPRPAYVLTYLNREQRLLADIVGSDESLRRRISGTGWWSDERVAWNRSQLEQRFFLRQREPLDQTQFGYDAFYLAAYALSWADTRVPLDGPGVALGFEHVISGADWDVGPTNIRSGLVQLSEGADLHLRGSSSELDGLDPSQIPRADATLWCLTRNPDGSLQLLDSAGPVWRAASGEITGSYSCP
jgi:hypothetical protein